jgi:hypothetical protein
MQCGEIGFLPAVRSAEPSSLIIANGFSCKTQLEQSGIDRRALHVAEVMRLAGGLSVPRLGGAMPEHLSMPRPQPSRSTKATRNAATLGLAALAMFAGVRALVALASMAGVDRAPRGSVKKAA